MKSDQRNGFTFYKSYYDILNKLDRNDGYDFMKALLDRQFLGVETKLNGMAEFAYLSQKHSIDKQVEGWENKTGNKLTPYKGTKKDPYQPPTEGGHTDPSYPPDNDTDMTNEGGTEDPYLQEQEQEQEQEKEEEQLKIKKLYLENKTEIEYIRNLYNLNMEDAINFFFSLE